MIKYWVVEASYLVGGGDISNTKEYFFETKEKAMEFYLNHKDRDNFKYSMDRVTFEKPKEKVLKFDEDFIRCKVETYRFENGKYSIYDISEPRYDTIEEAKKYLKSTVEWYLERQQNSSRYREFTKAKVIAYIENEKYIEEEVECKKR